MQEATETRGKGTGRSRELRGVQEKLQRIEEAAINYRKLVFGENSRYVNASMSKLQIPQEDAKMIIKWLDKQDGILLLYGAPGRGKSYLCSAIIEEIIKLHGQDFRYFREADLLEKLRKTIGDGRCYSSELKYMIDYRCLILDDLGSTGTNNTSWRQEVMFDLVDQLYSQRVPVIVTTNLYNNEINQIYGHRFESRLFARENTLICVDSWPNFREQGL